MLAKKNRLVRETFNNASSRTYHGPFFSLKISFGVSEHQCAVVVSKKVGRTAVIRHRIKRRVYTLLRNMNLRACRATIFVKPSAMSLSYRELAEALRALFEEATAVKQR